MATPLVFPVRCPAAPNAFFFLLCKTYARKPSSLHEREAKVRIWPHKLAMSFELDRMVFWSPFGAPRCPLLIGVLCMQAGYVIMGMQVRRKVQSRRNP